MLYRVCGCVLAYQRSTRRYCANTCSSSALAAHLDRRAARSRMPQVMRPAVSLAQAVVRPVLLREARQIVEQNEPMCGVPTLRL
jgi:hypothetical protein